MIMEIGSWIALGLIAGALARIAMPGPAAGGVLAAILIGLLGALTGGLVGTTLLEETSTSIVSTSTMIAIIGAIYSLFVFRCLALRLREPENPKSS